MTETCNEWLFVILTKVGSAGTIINNVANSSDVTTMLNKEQNAQVNDPPLAGRSTTEGYSSNAGTPGWAWNGNLLPIQCAYGTD